MKAKPLPLNAVTWAAISVLFLSLLPFPGIRATELPDPLSSNLDALRAHVRYLASDELMGRGVDSPGIDLARDYIGREFKQYGLLSGGESAGYFQPLHVVTGVKIQEPTSASLAKGAPLVLNRDWIPLGFSSSKAVEGEVVFAGYGITAKDRGYDDYSGIDAKGKIVLVLRYEPPPKDAKSPFQKHPRYSRHATFRAKLSNARDHGAIGMILVDLTRYKQSDPELIPLHRSLGRRGTGLVAVQITGEILEKSLREIGVSLRELKERIDREERPASAPLPGLRASFTVTLEEIRKKTDNVIAILPGSDPRLKDEVIVIGAHYDHLGLGYFGARNRSSEGKIHYGADDNASGTAVLLDLAQRLSRRSRTLPRTVVFVAFSGEELGTYGSRHYVNHPPFPLGSTKAMINLDMVGRLRENRVAASGIDTAKEFRDLVSTAAQEIGIELRPSSNVGSSDHASFYNKGIPVLHFHTGRHEDYHRPTDTWEKLNIEGMARVSDLVLRTVEKLASLREPLTFKRVPPKQG